MRVSERTVRSGEVELATEPFGDPADPAVLLIMGAMASMLWWPDGFCKELAARGRHVIRYDSRDTGLSTTYPPGAPPYSSDDMVDDTIRILDGHGLGSAHFVGISAGGAVAQLAALAYPGRVLSLTAISTSPVGGASPDLPPSTDAYNAHAAEGEHVDWSDRDQVIAYMLEDARMIAGTAHPFDAAAARALITRDVDRARNFASATNHFLLKPGDRPRARLATLKAPLLVIHGTADPLLPVAHGKALAEAVPGARFLALEGGGHELHPAHWDAIIGAIVAHTS
jgi:pimeloyl-ACP methyl ester carboxylesterase